MATEVIYHPIVTKTVVPYGAPIDVSLGGIITNWIDGIFVFVLYGDIWFAASFWNGFGSPTNRVFLRVKSDGRFCWYSDTISPQLVPWNSGYINAPILNGDVITSSTPSDTKTIILPSLFINGGWVYTPSINNVFPQPCGINAQTIKLVLAANNKALVEYINPAGANNYFLWAATGAYINGKFNINNGGYVGNFPNGVDPIFDNSSLNNITSVTYGTNNTKISYTPFGMHAKSVEFKDLFGHFDCFFNAAVVDGALTCDGRGVPLPNAKIDYYKILDRFAPEFNGTQFNYYFENGNTSASDIDGVYCIGNSYNEIALFNGVEFIAIQPMAYLGNTGCMGIINDVCVQVTTSVKPSVYISVPLNLQIAPLPKINLPVTNSLLNWHRPVSTRGVYKT